MMIFYVSQPLSRIIVYKCVTDIETSWFVSLIAAKISQKSWNCDDSNNDDDFSFFAVYVLSRQALIVIFFDAISRKQVRGKQCTIVRWDKL